MLLDHYSLPISNTHTENQCVALSLSHMHAQSLHKAKKMKNFSLLQLLTSHSSH